MEQIALENSVSKNARWVLIVEDEARLRDAFVKQLNSIAADLGEICTASTVEEALVLCRQDNPTAAFIDINLPGTSGMRLAEILANDVDVVLVTAHAEYAVQAFSTGAADYLLKPVTEARLQVCVERLRKRIAARHAGMYTKAHTNTHAAAHVNANANTHAEGDAIPPHVSPIINPEAPTANTALKWLAATRGRKTYLIAVEDIIFMKADNKYIRVVCRDKEHLIEEPLKGIIARLDPNHFRQVHRSAVVNLREVLLVERDEAGAGTVKFRHHSEELRISAPYLRELRMFLV